MIFLLFYTCPCRPILAGFQKVADEEIHNSIDNATRNIDYIVIHVNWEYSHTGNVFHVVISAKQADYGESYEMACFCLFAHLSTSHSPFPAKFSPISTPVS